jgi:diguanylate cyclase (GGDEF)-like protein
VVATRIIGRWVATGGSASEQEHATIAKGGDGPLVGSGTLADLTKSYLAWRDATIGLIAEESDRLGLGTATRELAVEAVRSSCDASLVRMSRQFGRTRSYLESLLKDERLRLAHAALHDRLTGLANRVQLLDRLAAVVEDPSHRHRSALLVIDLDHFKEVNDQLGHAVGDELLVAVAGRLAAAVRDCDTVARFGGDEFVVLAIGLSSGAPEADELAQRLVEMLSLPFRLAGCEVALSASIGVSVVAAQDCDSLLSRVDRAMYHAERADRCRHAHAD